VPVHLYPKISASRSIINIKYAGSKILNIDGNLSGYFNFDLFVNILSSGTLVLQIFRSNNTRFISDGDLHFNSVEF
jgi:hypothetical protein